MKTLGGAVLLALLGPQADPVEAARRELGDAFACERLDPGVLLASDAGGPRTEAVKASLRKAVRALRDDAFDPSPRDAILVCCFKDTEGFRAYTGKRYPEAFELPAFHDVVHRRLLVHADIAESFAPPSVMIYLLGEHLGTPVPAPWAAAAVTALDEKRDEVESIFDAHAALLRGRLRQGGLPALRDLVRMGPADFRAPGRSGLHATLAKKFALFLRGRGLLKNFFAEFKTSARRDPTGAAALETALGRKVDEIQKEFFAHLETLPWVREDRFRDHARKGFEGDVLLKTDDDLFVAVASDADPAGVARALGELKKLHGPLLRSLELQPTGLPITVRLFRNETSFQNFARAESPDRGWFAGYYVPTTRSIAVNLSADPAGLTHEFCHSLFEDDLGVMPPWANEGLASLYQEFRIENEAPVAEPGQTLKSARAALDRGSLPALADLVQMKAQAFYGDRERMHLHYESSRAVFLYAQDRGKVRDFLRQYRAARAANKLAPPLATCRESLEKALGMKTPAIDEDFRKWLASDGKR